MTEIVVYEKVTCSKSQKALQLLTESGVPFTVCVYHDTPLSAEKLLELAQKMGVPVSALIRTGEEVYTTLSLDTKSHTDADLAEIAVENPDLIQRPIVEMGERAVLARPPEKVLEIIELYKQTVA